MEYNEDVVRNTFSRQLAEFKYLLKSVNLNHETKKKHSRENHFYERGIPELGKNL